MCPFKGPGPFAGGPGVLQGHIFPTARAAEVGGGSNESSVQGLSGSAKTIHLARPVLPQCSWTRTGSAYFGTP